MGFFQNTCKPKGFGGKIMVKEMNGGNHADLAEWGFSFLKNIPSDSYALDAGCGGGANVARWLKQCPRGMVYGLDYSEISVAESRRVNDDAVKYGRCKIVLGNVAKMPFTVDTFDYISAFETVYFWPDLSKTFGEIFRITKPSGYFIICNESNGHDESSKKFAKIIHGMNLYDAYMLEKHLKNAGFKSIVVHEKPENNWLAVIAKK